MNTLGHIQDNDSFTKYLHLALCLGLGGICISLSFYNLPLFGCIALLPIIIVAALSLLRYPWAILLLIYVVNYFIMGFNRYIPIEGISVVMDILYVLAAILILIHSTLYRNIDWKKAVHTLTITSCIWAGYCILEFINPTASTQGWILSRSLIFSGLIITVITSLLCTQYRIVKTLLFTLSILTLLAIIKALIQKFCGFDAYETTWLNASGAKTHIIHSGIRYFSFFTDAGNMGSNMGGACVIFGIVAFYMRSHIFRIYYSLISILALYTMFLSGTRGAMVVPLVGLALFTIVSKQTKAIISGTSLLLFIYIFFAFTTIGQGNSMIRRMRTAFSPTEDASFNIRKENQQKLASYLKYRPFGEGLGLSGDGLGTKVSNRFTTSIPTDSWYVKIWVETGSVGLIIYLGMVFSTIGRGMWIIMFRIRDRELKGILSGLLCGIFGLSLSAYGNSFWGQFPTMIIVFTGLSIILNGGYFDQEIENRQIQNPIL